MILSIITKILIEKLEIVWKDQNTEIFLGENTLQISVKKFLWSKKWKLQYQEHILLVILTKKKLFEHFIYKSCRKQAKSNSGLKM